MIETDSSNEDLPKEKKEKIICSNCDAKIKADVAFCPKCGQKQVASKISMRNFLWKLWITTFHLDNKLLLSLKYILWPPKLTREYFAGRHKKYLHPIQFYFIALFFLFFTISKFNKGKSFSLFDHFGNNGLEYVKGQLDMKEQIRDGWDSLPAPWRNDDTKKSVDSLLARATLTVAYAEKDSVGIEFFKNEHNESYSIANHDMLNMSKDSLLTYYHINGWFHRLCVGQFVKSSTQSDDLKRYWVGIISWSLLVLVAVMALWLKLLYHRHNRFFVEHFVLMLHLQIGFFVAFLLVLFLRKGLGFSKSIGFLVFLWFAVASFMALKSYYQQGYAKTLLKWFIFHFLYLISMMLIFISSMAAAVLLF